MKKRYVRYLANDDKNNGITIIAKSNEEAEYPIYLYVDSMVIEDQRSGCYWHVMKVGPYLQKKIHQMPSFFITIGESIG